MPRPRLSYRAAVIVLLVAILAVQTAILRHLVTHSVSVGDLIATREDDAARERVLQRLPVVRVTSVGQVGGTVDVRVR